MPVRPPRFVALALVVLATLVPLLGLPPAAAAGSGGGVEYRPPVAEPPSTTFRPPVTPFGPGDRGVEYVTAPGEPVDAAADGTVTFAGPVAGALHVVVRHADGLRTSYSFVASVAVARGDHVSAGTALATSSGTFHFGVRAGSVYLDPLALFTGRPTGRAHLVVDDGAPLPPAAEERDGLLASLGGLARSTVAATRAAASVTGAAVVAAAARLASLGRACTPPGQVAPRLPSRHAAVLVGGLGSSSTSAAIFGLDTAAVGYAPGDVVRFSYRGGDAAHVPYGPADTQGDIRAAGDRLRALIARVAAERPTVPIDVLAHSQGGLVALAALTGGPTAPVASLVALGSPFHGADLATAAALVGRSPAGAALEEAASHVAGGLRAGSVSVHQLSQTSALVRWLVAQPLPAGVAVTSVAARGDLVVPSPRSWLDGATNVVVDIGGLTQHSDLPASGPARREVALAVSGRPPTCRDLGQVARDVVTGEAISIEEDLAGLAMAAALGATP